MRITPYELDENIFKLINKDWMLICANDGESANAMTASFGGFGIFCFKEVCHIYVRPERYTFDLLEKNDTFSINFFNESYRDVLKFCGAKSGRDVDKIKENNLTLDDINGTKIINEAKLSIVCGKMFATDIKKEDFCDMNAFDLIEKDDISLHRMYIGEIKEIIKK